MKYRGCAIPDLPGAISASSAISGKAAFGGAIFLFTKDFIGKARWSHV